MKKITRLSAIILLICLCLSGCAEKQDDIVLFDPMDASESALQTGYSTEPSTTVETTLESTTETTLCATEPSTRAPTEPTEVIAPTKTEPARQPEVTTPVAPMIAEKEDPPKATESQSVTPVSNMVWIPTKGGKKYHAKATCSGMNGPEEVTKTEAENRGFTPCKKCYK